MRGNALTQYSNIPFFHHSIWETFHHSIFPLFRLLLNQGDTHGADPFPFSDHP